ncbi:tripartite motif-containing protein 16-like protein isoform X3 [Megalobrama amblycephala]|uniref:tripartite motif-containing protein 16-like protein isoform X3 n=1 Tax=Megalobrama amblycephala TaxID=75352 RepID=UPI00201441DE|nr:tripartite motif-containing protein 16-like protein isoform X3 [Megalobrama amblycephala]
MADDSILWSQEQFNCSICLDLLKDPVTIPCGHSYCMNCITGCWDQDDQKRVYSCPQCRQTFTPRPVLGKSTMLVELVEKLKKAKLQAARPVQCYTESGDVECDVCTGDKNKAIKSCLSKLGEMQRKFQQRIQERQKELEDLREAVESHKRSAQAAAEDSERIFTELIRSIERSRSEVTQLIRDQEKTAVSRAEEILEQLEQEIDDLRRRDAELEQLSHTDHHIHFLQSFRSLSVPPGSTDSSRITVSSRLSFDDVGKSVSQLREKLEHFCREEIEKISGRVTYIVIIPTPEPKTREDFLQYSHQLTLDLNTVNKNLLLSEGNRVIKYTDTVQPYPDHPDRFDSRCQVLCRESVCGRCYWEAEWSGKVGLSVSYKSISRKGQRIESEFGRNDQSWCLFYSDSSCSFWHNNKHTSLPVVSSSCRIGVYVDHSAGTLSFYSVSDTMTLIHRVHTTFTQPLYGGFEFSSVWKSGSRVKLYKL